MKRIILSCAVLTMLATSALAQPKAKDAAANRYDVSKADTILDWSKFDWGSNSNAGTLRAVEIGSQWWMAENLNTDKFRNGDAIPEAETKEAWVAAANDQKPAWC